MNVFFVIRALGVGVCAALASAQVSVTVNASMDLYRAGNYNDGSDGTAPAIFSFSALPGRTLNFSAVNGTWSCNSSALPFTADGTSASPCFPTASVINPVGTFAGYNLTDFTGALAGMFLEDTLPSSAPSPLRFYESDSSVGGIQTNFASLSPKIGQAFFIGDGLTGTETGAIQTFNVPAAATHLYLGYVKTCVTNGKAAPGCYSANIGSLTATFKFTDHVLDWHQLSLSSVPSARCCPGMDYDDLTGTTVLFGGGNGGEAPYERLGDTWEFNGAWKQLSPLNSPPAREGAGMAYDASTGTMVLFGGQSITNADLSDTWLWDGTNWVEEFPAVSPPARAPYERGMIYDAATETVLLFGGGGVSGPLNDTWAWSGKTKTWTQLFPEHSPSPRLTALTYDKLRGYVLLFGGYNAMGDCCSTTYNDTWIWSGVDWTQLDPTNVPPARTYPALVYDLNLNGTVLYGGYETPGEGYSDTWLFSDGEWNLLNPSLTPGGRWAMGDDFDKNINAPLLFGGEITGDPFSNQSWTFTFVPVR